MRVHSSDPRLPLFLREGVNFDSLPTARKGGGGDLKNYKKGVEVWCLKKVILSCLKMNLKISHILR